MISELCFLKYWCHKMLAMTAWKTSGKLKNELTSTGNLCASVSMYFCFAGLFLVKNKSYSVGRK